jgi:hypothetical protein
MNPQILTLVMQLLRSANAPVDATRVMERSPRADFARAQQQYSADSAEAHRHDQPRRQHYFSNGRAGVLTIPANPAIGQQFDATTPRPQMPEPQPLPDWLLNFLHPR